MKRLTCLGLLVFTLFFAIQCVQLRRQQLSMERLLWEEFDAGIHGLVRMLRLAEATSDAPFGSVHPALLAALEHDRTVARLAPVAEQLLARRGVRAEPLAGYLLSLTGGVASLCGTAHVDQTVDRTWVAEIRGRLEEVRESLRPPAPLLLDRKTLQKRIDALFGADPTTLYYTVPVQLAAFAC